MSANADRLRDLYRRFWLEKDWEAGREVFAADAEWRGMEAAGLDEVRRGPREIGNLFREWLDAWENVSNEFEVEEIDDDTILVISHFRGTGRASGIELVLDLFQVYEFEDGMVVCQTMYRSADEAREALRAREG